MKTPPVLVNFLERASVAVAATRDRGGVPGVHWVSGWTMEPDGETLVALVAEGFTEGLLESLADNGQFALTAEVIGPHDTYQYKGEYAGTRPLGPEDQGLFEAGRERYVRGLIEAYGEAFDPEAARRHFRPPALAVRFRVRAVFVQTPGPAAGMKVFPREEAP